MANDSLYLKPQGSDDGDDQHLVINKSPYRIGRRSDNDLQIARPDISGRHAEFTRRGSDWWISDNQSTNGTFVNGKRISEATVVRLGDVVHLATKGYLVVPELPGEDSKQFTTKVLGDSSEIRAVMELLKVINEQHTYPHYQPISRLDTKETIGWETLGRAMTDSGPMNAGPLFWLAAQNRVEAKLSQRFRESSRACLACHHCWPKDGKRYAMFVNLHPAEIHDPLFLPSLEEFSKSDVANSFELVIEMPESWVCNSSEMRTLVKQIHDLGLLVAYDDFGQGQSRIADLITVPPDYLKLDRELIAELGTNRIKSGLVKAIVDACRELNVKTIGEGIETIEEYQACIDMNIDLGQGYFIGYPQPPYQTFQVAPPALVDSCLFLKLGVIQR